MMDKERERERKRERVCVCVCENDSFYVFLYNNNRELSSVQDRVSGLYNRDDKKSIARNLSFNVG